MGAIKGERTVEIDAPIERVFEINRNFRNEGISTQHNPEFTMLEFYQAYADYHDLMALTEDMLSSVATEVTGRDELTFGAHTLSLRAPFRRLSLRDGAAAAASAMILRFWAASRSAATRTPSRANAVYA